MTGEQASGDQSVTKISCTEVLEQLERYLDGELPEARLEHLRSHLSRCYPCADRADFEEQVRALVRECCTEEAPDELMGRIREQLENDL